MNKDISHQPLRRQTSNKAHIIQVKLALVYQASRTSYMTLKLLLKRFRSFLFLYRSSAQNNFPKLKPFTLWGHPPTTLPSVNGSIANRQPIPVGTVTPATVKVEPVPVTSMDTKPIVSMLQPRPVNQAQANVNILNNLSQPRQVMNSAALSGGTSMGLPSMGQTLVAIHMSNMISNGMTSSGPAGQNVFSSGPPAITSSRSLTASAQVRQNSGPVDCCS
ncbi:hypothetical protein KIW84_055412 [Lathyrus oleraceus]|uniref:Uncharacterized protein n=1 Tax=Pisum sativum TaxID=3888 RepID=A0A9D5AJR5_PEA|nr:hypothetical protein KIW84_055412 [Pisum sativum]